MNSARWEKIKNEKAFCLLIFISVNCLSIASEKIPESANKWAYEILSIPQLTTKPQRVVTVAIVDDAFRFSHKALSGFLYTNPNEIPGNYRDDDHNEYIDDVHGWDISDADNDVSIPEGREETFYHGTHIAGIITAVFKQLYGENYNDYLKIIPVKVLANNAKTTYLADGYKGIQYACQMNPDIICCAWSGGAMTNDTKVMLSKAMERGTIVVASAGNFGNEKVEYPSAFQGVVSVAAVDSSLKKADVSNYGMRIDVAAPGVYVYGPSPVADNAFLYSDGTSPATALVTGCLAALKSYRPDVSSEELINAVKNTSTPIDIYNSRYTGKLGAGLPNIAKAIEYLNNPVYKYQSFNPTRPEGQILYKKKITSGNFEINPEGAFKGIHLLPSSPDYNGNVRIYNKDSVFYSGAIKGLGGGIYIPGSRISMAIQPKPKPSKEMAFSYYVETIDSTTLYCKDIQTLKDTMGVITDNSGDKDYANFCSCKWQIKVPEGKKVKIEFLEMDTQPNVDYVYIFDGNSTLQENLLAKFSGQKIPPAITSLTNEVLIWFVTDGFVTGKGWKLKYEPTEQSIFF